MPASRIRLFTPGPVEIPPRILRVLAEPPPHHRTDGFRATLKRVNEKLRWLHGTEGEVFLLAASGTGAMEAALVSIVSPGTKALAIVGGKFGERWAEIAVLILTPITVFAAVEAAYFTLNIPLDGTPEQGRYAFPAITALAAIVIGACVGVGRKRALPVAMALVVGLMGLTFAGQFLQLASFYT